MNLFEVCDALRKPDRLRALLRRQQSGLPQLQHYGDLRLDDGALEARIGDQLLALTAAEAPPTPGAPQLSEKAKNMQRLAKSGRGRGEGGEGRG